MCDHQLNTCLFSSIHSTNMYCTPNRVRQHDKHWEYRNEKLIVSVIIAFMLMEDSRKRMKMVNGKWRGSPKWPGETLEMLPKKVMLMKDRIITGYL